LHGLREHLFHDTFTADQAMGTLTPAWAEKLGLSEQVVIGVGSFDAHMGAVGAGIEPYALVRVMGTSTCDMLITPTADVGNRLIHGICGQVNGSILPGMMGMEAGQSAFGDVYAWFQNLLAFSLNAFLPPAEAEKLIPQIIPALAEKAAQLPLSAHDPVALDWFNGRRTPDANHTLKGAIMQMNLGTDAPLIFKTLVEATAFGAKSIVERFQNEGIPIQQVIGIGGVSKKSPFVMQTLANVLNMPIKIVRSEQACALGAAICAAAAAGVYPSLAMAQSAMTSGFDEFFYPQPEKVEVYVQLYQQYQKLGQFIENIKA
jgi:L-ribulokinase